jgi:U6 snRNA-associated Sm-like protein LSm6
VNFRIKNNNSSTIIGILSCLDGYMNIALEQTEEWVDGVVTQRFGDAFIRGNNGK